MARFPTMTELRKRAAFQFCETYLHSVLPNHPRFAAFPSLVEAFKQFSDPALDGTDPIGEGGLSPEEAGQVRQASQRAASQAPVPEGSAPMPRAQPDNQTAMSTTSSATEPSDDTGMAVGSETDARIITPQLIAELISIWVLSAAQASRTAPLLGERSGGLYLLTTPAGNTSLATEPFEAVLNDPLLQALWRGDVPPAKHPPARHPRIRVRSVSEIEDAAKLAGSVNRSAVQFAKIRDELNEGVRIYLSCPQGQDIPPDLAALVLAELALPPVDLDMIYGLHCLLYPKRLRLKVEAFAAIPVCDAISYSDLALALCYDKISPTTQILTRLIKSRQTSTAVAQGPRLEDLVGNAAAVTLCLQICQDLESWRQGKLDWSDMANGVFASGPPGCGKSLLAAALALNCDVELFKCSYADCAQDSAQRGSSGIIEHLFAVGRKAAAAKGAIVFIDEIDGFGQSRFGRQDHNSTYYRTLTTALLRFLDDMRAAPGVIVMAATNDVAAVDPAIIRAGRFDHHITLTTPNLADIETLLARELPTLPATAIVEAGRHLLGASFADVTTLIRSVKSTARANSREPEIVDLTALLASNGNDLDGAVEQEDLWRIAVHEAGHVIVDYVQTGTVTGQVMITSREGSVTRRSHLHFTEERLHQQLSMLLAGRAAERLMFGNVGSGSGAGPHSDLARATYFAMAAHQSWHLPTGTDLIWRPVYEGLSAPINPSIRDEIKQLLQARERAAYEILRKHKAALVQFAENLIEVRQMDRAAVATRLRALIPDHPPTGGQVKDGLLGKTGAGRPDHGSANPSSESSAVSPALKGLSAPTDQ